ncbi:MAG: type II secretion system protein [Eubacteriales bacterium]
MKSNKKRGFTLVELLVVIAILAILATVSVVGYTSFIERASVSNDENVATQLNQFLIALKADSNSEYYGEDITPENAREILNHVLKESGLGELEPQSAQYGYHFYFDLKEGKVVLSRDAINEVSLAMHIIRGFRANALTYNVSDNPATCFTNTDDTFADYNGIRYVFLDTAGSELAELVNLFYGVNTAEDFARLQELASGTLLDGKSIPALNALVNKSIFVGSAGSFMTNTADEKTLFFGTVATEYKYNGNTEVPAFEVPTSGVMNVPSTIKFLTENSLNFTSNEYVQGNAPYTTVLHFELTLDKIAEKADPSFTNVVFTLADGVQYACVGNEIIRVEDGVVVKTIAPKNPVASFDFKADDTDVANKVYNYLSDEQSNVVYIAWDKGTFKVEATKLVGEHDDIYGAVSSYNIEWDVHSDSSSYVQVVNKATGEFKFIGSAPNVVNDECIVKIVAKDTISATEETFEIKIVRVKGATFAYDGKGFATTNTLLFGEGSKDSYTITATPSRTYATITEITLDNAISITPVVVEGKDNVFAPEGDLLKLNGEADGTQSITITVGEYTSEPFSVTVYNADSLVAVKNNSNLIVVGDDNAITVGDLLKLNPGKTMPEGAQVWILKELGDSNFGNMNAYFESEYVSNGKIPVNTSDWTATEIQFTGNGGKAIVTVVAPDGEGNYIRIADNHEVTIVDGKNVRDYSEFASDVNNVLVSHITKAYDDPVLSFGAVTVYGNGFTLDMRQHNHQGQPTGESWTGDLGTYDHYITDEAFITLNGSTLNNLKVVGEVYKSSDFMYQDPTTFAYGASLVKATNSNIINCYLSNTRSPLVTYGAVTVQDTILFGGNFANIDVRDGATLTLKGNITTVNQIIAGVTDDTIGFGILVDLFADYETTSIVIDNDGDDKCTLRQYNYVSQNDRSKMPIVTYQAYGQDVNIIISNKLNKIFTDTTGVYDSVVYKDANGIKYLNATIAFANGLRVLMNGSDSTSASGAKTGNGQQITGLTGYEMKTVVSHREKSVNLGCTTATVTMDATIFLWTPTADVNTNSGENFNNTVPENCLPGYYIPAN